MGLFKHFILEDSIEIRTTPEAVWEFWVDMENNYKSWHPESHVLFRWKNGKPLEVGSVAYGEEIFHGKIHKIAGKVIESEPFRKFVLRPKFPMSWFCRRLEYRIEPKGETTLFIAIHDVRFGRIALALAKNKIDEIIAVGEKHMREEGENMKKILESRN